MLYTLHYLIKAVQPFLIPICFVFTWIFIILLGWSLWSAIGDTLAKSKRMHEIPCSNCQFFTNDYRLKCTVHPLIANTEQAIDCGDYCSKNNYFNSKQKVV